MSALICLPRVHNYSEHAFLFFHPTILSYSQAPLNGSHMALCYLKDIKSKAESVPSAPFCLVALQTDKTDGCASSIPWQPPSDCCLSCHIPAFIQLALDAAWRDYQSTSPFSFNLTVIRYSTSHVEGGGQKEESLASDFANHPQCSVCNVCNLLDINSGLLAASDSRVLFFEAGGSEVTGCRLICMDSLITAPLL